MLGGYFQIAVSLAQVNRVKRPRTMVVVRASQDNAVMAIAAQMDGVILTSSFRKNFLSDVL
jgi:hypothetical protein